MVKACRISGRCISWIGCKPSIRQASGCARARALSEAAGCCSTSVHEADRGLGGAPFGEVEAVDIVDSIDIDDTCIDRGDNGLDDGLDIDSMGIDRATIFRATIFLFHSFRGNPADGPMPYTCPIKGPRKPFMFGLGHNRRPPSSAKTPRSQKRAPVYPRTARRTHTPRERHDGREVRGTAARVPRP